jgi:hypothetical protein
MQEITNIRSPFFNISANVRRVLWFYSFLGRFPIVVIRVPERQRDQPYADVTAAVRGLADDFGLRVIVDGSPNSIPPEIKATERQLNIHVMPLERNQIAKISELSELNEFLRKHSLENAVWDVLGGSPQRYMTLAENVSIYTVDDFTDPEKIISEVKDHLHSILLDTLNENITNCSATTDKILDIFRSQKFTQISVRDLKKEGILLDFPNKVFRVVERDKHRFVEPASSAVGLIIQENIVNDDDVAKLVEKLFSRRNNSGVV